MWGTIAAGVVGAIAGSRGGGGWQGAIGGALGGIFGGGGSGAGIGGWLGGLFEGIFNGMQSRREAASSHAVDQSFQQVAPRNGVVAGNDDGIRIPQFPGRPVQSPPFPTPVQTRPGNGCWQPQPPSCQPLPQPLPAPPPPSHGCGQPEPPRVQPQPQPLPQPPVEERGCCCCACCQSEPSPSDGSLRVVGDKVITAGGYEIEMLSRTEWKITGPDGHSTRIWGDPHVDQSGTGSNKDWDFHRNTTFVLGDGTEIHVKTVEAKKGWTITGELTIISGNDRVVVSGIDQGKGKIGEVTQDGLQYTNSFGDYDVVVQGPQTNQWTFEGRQIIGSKHQGREFILGDRLEPGYNHQAGNGYGWKGGLAWPLWMTSTASTHQNGHDHDSHRGRA